MTGRHAAARRRYRRPVKLVRRGSAVLAAAFVIAMITNASHSGGASATGTTTTTASSAGTTTTDLDGEGTWDVNAEMLGWQNDLYGSNGAINLNYLAEGGGSGRDDLLAGSVDYAISGVPYTSAELASYGKTASDIIAAPIMPSAVGFLVNPPVGGFYTEDSDGNPRPDYSGPLRIASDNLAGQLFFYTLTPQQTPSADAQYEEPGDSSYPYNEWDNPEILKNWDSSLQYDPGNGDVFIPSQVSPEEIQQAERNEDTYYLEDWTQQAAPTMWGLLQQQYDKHPSASDPWQPSEQLQPGVNVSQTSGLDQVLGDVVGNDTGARNQNTGGVIAPVPPSSLQVATAEQAALIAQCQASGRAHCPSSPSTGEDIEWASLQNDDGDWVTPTPQAIDAAVDAAPAGTATATTGATPLYAATNPVAGAYPLTYIDYLYAPSTGLSVAKTEALATTIRYLVTDGQNELAGNGDGQLSQPLINQALAAANQVVTSNCPAAGGTVLLTAASMPDTPNLPGIQALGPVDHCEAPAASSSTTTSTTMGHSTPTTVKKHTKTPVTTTTTAKATTTTIHASTPTGGGGSGSGGTSHATTTPAQPPSKSSSGSYRHHSTSPTPAHVSTATPKQIIAAEASSNLPLPVSTGNGAGLDKVAALAVGVVLFLLLRRRPAALLKRLLGG